MWSKSPLRFLFRPTSADRGLVCWRKWGLNWQKRLIKSAITACDVHKAWKGTIRGSRKWCEASWHLSAWMVVGTVCLNGAFQKGQSRKVLGGSQMLFGLTELSWERFSGCVPPLCSSFPCHFRAKSWPERQVTWPFKPMSGNLQKTPRTAAMLVPSRFLNSATLYGAGRQVGFEDFMGSNYPLVNIQKAIENGPLTVDLPINSMVIFHSYVNLPEGIFSISYSI